MILIADGGSTKVDWAYITDVCLDSDSSYSSAEKELPKNNVIRIKTEGINPVHVSKERIIGVLRDNLLHQCPSVEKVYFFGAGLVGEDLKATLKECFCEIWPKSEVYIGSDIMACALALFGKTRGIACILGTGSNSSLVENAQIISSVPAGGYILGDEGSGNWIGKSLLQDYIKGIMPLELSQEFEKQYELTYPKIVSKVYREEKPAAYMASMNMFAIKHVEHPYIKDLVKSGFEQFLLRNVMRYDGYESIEVGFVGSIAMLYEDILRQCCAQHKIKVKKIIKAPIEALVEYYESNGELI